MVRIEVRKTLFAIRNHFLLKVPADLPKDWMSRLKRIHPDHPVLVNLATYGPSGGMGALVSAGIHQFFSYCFSGKSEGAPVAIEMYPESFYYFHTYKLHPPFKHCNHQTADFYD